MTSPCCNAPLWWTSYNQELWKVPKVDHWTCSECHCLVTVTIDPANIRIEETGFIKGLQMEMFGENF